jgi:hypothetical protein
MDIAWADDRCFLYLLSKLFKSFKFVLIFWDNQFSEMRLLTYIHFGYLNYIRQHRYIREIIIVIVFHIFFWAFLYNDKPEDSIWTVLNVFAILLNLATAPSLFFLEKGNTLHFYLSKPYGRRNLFLSKIILSILIDLAWILLFALIYGIRFSSADFFLFLLVRLPLVTWILLITTLLISLSYSYRPQLSWLVFALIIFGSIVNKGALLPINGFGEIYKILAFFLPPLLELNFLTADLSFVNIHFVFVILALVHIAGLFWVSYRGMMRKDLL